MKKWVVLSCTPDSAYDFFLPIAVRLWKNRIGYEPVIILVGTEKDWSSGHAKVVYDEIRGRERIEFFESIPGLPNSTVSQGLRQHASALEFGEDDILLIGDVDLFPIDIGFYHRYDPSKHPIGIYYSEMYEGQYWPAYGVSMPVRHWREVMGVTVGDFRGSVERTFLEGNVRELIAAHEADYRDTRYWFFDERYASLKIKASRFVKDIGTFSSSIEGRFPQRVKLPNQPYAFAYIDFHCSRPGWTEDNWPDIRHMLAQIIPQDLRWIDRYVDVYLKSVEGRDVRSDSLKATPLSWDSEAFGVRVGLLELFESSTPPPRTISIIEANREQLDVVFVKMAGWHNPRGAAALDYTYEMELCGHLPAAGDSAVVELQAPRAAHIAIARDAFVDSRFNRDMKLAGKAGDFYEKWLSGAGTLYALEAMVDDAFLFVSVDPDGTGRISLVAVCKKSRGTSIGGTLIRNVMHRRHELQRWRVRVSSRNLRAIKFYEKLGFRMKSVQTTYHVWTENGA